MPAMQPGARAMLGVLVLSCVAACIVENSVSEAEKALFLRAADLAPFGFQYQNAEAHERFSKLRLFDGSRELT